MPSGKVAWLHFVGRGYWNTISSFEREARKYGVSRRIALGVLKKMAWGDRIVLAHWQGKAIAFGEFSLDRISGLSTEVVEEIRNRFGAEMVDMGGGLVKRACGSYITGPSWAVSASVSEIARTVEQSEFRGPLMVAGRYSPLCFHLLENPAALGHNLRPHCTVSPNGPPFTVHCRVVLEDIPHRQGFRPFDYSAFSDAVEEDLTRRGARGMVKVKGQFYAHTERELEPEEGEVQEVVTYSRLGGDGG